MATTTNFGWTTPDDTDLVKDGAAAIRTLGSAIDTSLVDLKGGTTGQVLSKTSNTDMDFTWVAQDDTNAIQNSIMDAKGDLIVASGDDTPARLPIGSNNYVLTADSAETLGVKWAAAPSSSGPTFRASRNSTSAISANTWTKVPLSSEQWDSDSCFDSTTNYRFTPNKAGYYYLNGTVTMANFGGIDVIYCGIYKNGTQVSAGTAADSSTQGYGNCVVIDQIYFNGSTDYVELWAYAQAYSGNIYGTAAASQTFFTGVWIRS